jgi:hypothetical protein
MPSATSYPKRVLSEARKWKLSLVLPHQYLEQLPNKLRAGVLANVGTVLVFQLGGEDAETIAREIGLKNTALLTQLSRGEVWLKHATHGGPYHPRLPTPSPPTQKAERPHSSRTASATLSRATSSKPRSIGSSVHLRLGARPQRKNSTDGRVHSACCVGR